MSPYDPAWGPVLVGMRASGKSTLAPLLADALGMVAVDADEALCASREMSIAELVEAEGLEGLRRHEEALLTGDLLLRPGVVLATGGGAVLHGSVRGLLRRRPTFWLHAPLTTLARWIDEAPVSAHQRPPLTAAASTLEELELVFRHREPLYHEVADLHLASDRSPQELAHEAAQRWRELTHPGAEP